MQSVDSFRRLTASQLSRWRGFPLLRACLPLAVVGMEFCWVYPWVLLLTGIFYGRALTPLLPAWSVLGLLVFGHLAVGVAASTSHLRTGRIGVVAVGFVAGLLAVKHTYYPGAAVWDLRWMWALIQAAHDAIPAVAPPVMGALTATVLWWRGVVLGEREFMHAETEQAFERGVGWSVAFVLLAAVYGDSAAFTLTAPAVSYLLAFLALGLMVLAVARLVGIWEESHADDAQALAMNRHWLLMVALLVGAMLLVATGLSSLVGVNVWGPLTSALEPLMPIVEAVFIVLFAVAGVIARAILFALAHFPRVRPAATSVHPPDPFGDFLRRLQHLEVSPQVTSSARWGMVLGVVIVLLLLVALAVVRARRRTRRVGDDERESVWSARGVLGALGNAWRARRKGEARQEGEPEPDEVAVIRALYRQLLQLGTAAGHPRLRFQTPYDYLPRLREWVPPRDHELTLMTEAYVRARYTPQVPSPQEIAGVRAALEVIQRSLDHSPA